MADTNFQVHFRKSGVTAIWDGSHESILELAEAHGVDIPFSCRCGLDNVCESGLIRGEVSYPSEPLADVEEGNFLPCVAVPESDIEVDA